MSPNEQPTITIPKIQPIKGGAKQGALKEGGYCPLRFRSTGLGKTLIEGEAAGVKIVDDTLVLLIQSTKPVRWQIRAAMSYRGLLQAIKLALKPEVIKFLLLGWRTIKKPTLPEEF